MKFNNITKSQVYLIIIKGNHQYSGELQVKIQAKLDMRLLLENICHDACELTIRIS